MPIRALPIQENKKKKKEKGRIKRGGRQRRTVFLVSFTRG